jgi:hypothetical protein
MKKKSYISTRANARSASDTIPKGLFAGVRFGMSVLSAVRCINETTARNMAVHTWRQNNGSPEKSFRVLCENAIAS